MTSKHSSQENDQLEAFLDNLLTADEAKAYLDQSESPEEILAEKELQDQIDQSLCRMFQFTPPAIDQLIADAKENNSINSISTEEITNFEPATDVEPVVTKDIKSDSATTRRRLIWGSLAASLFFLIGLNLWPSGGGASGVIPRPVAQLYQQTVEIGFRPYYDCNDPEKFATEFERRQGKPLALTSLADGTSMLGISYPQAFSRNTTAVLFMVGNDPVMVFVDNQEADQEELAMTTPEDLQVFRRVENGLVFYEVTPLATASVIDSIEFIK